jgi:hypothetical protein
LILLFHLTYLEEDPVIIICCLFLFIHFFSSLFFSYFQLQIDSVTCVRATASQELLSDHLQSVVIGETPFIEQDIHLGLNRETGEREEEEENNNKNNNKEEKRLFPHLKRRIVSGQEIRLGKSEDCDHRQKTKKTREFQSTSSAGDGSRELQSSL